MGREEGSKKMKIAIIHPDLGIGNVLHQAFNEYPLNKRISERSKAILAERLIVDAVVELASHGHKVNVFTSHHDQSRCFEATLSGVFQVTVYGSFLSRHIFYRCLFVCSLCSLGMVYLRCCTSRPGFSRCPIALLDEHFGIVPLEAMAAYKPVIACNSGGPVETIKNGVTGYLCELTPEDFSSAMAKFIESPELAKGMGSEARKHVVETFSVNQYLVHVLSSPKED